MIKELIDNSLDACEEVGTPPVIDVVVNAEGITVIDNGPGIPPATVDRLVHLFEKRNESG